MLFIYNALTPMSIIYDYMDNNFLYYFTLNSQSTEKFIFVLPTRVL